MVVLAYIGYGFLVLALASVAGSYFPARKGIANPMFATQGFIATMGLVFGVPCYFVGTYLRDNGDESFTFLILVIAAPLGFLLGLGNRAD